jgi:putative molybdopterin biosynthesis protein
MNRNAIGPLAAARGWSDGELARRSGLDRAHLNLLKNGRAQPQVATALALASALGVSVATVFPPGASTARRTTSCRRS